MCNNTVEVALPHGHNYRLVRVQCGRTDPHGRVAICNGCARRLQEGLPQGWRHVPGDTCKHGTYVGDAYGPDYICGQCEDGE